MQQAVSAAFRSVFPADNEYAAYALPYSPYFAASRVLFWAVVERDETERLVGLVQEDGEFVPAEEATAGVFVAYYFPDKQPREEIEQLAAEIRRAGLDAERQRTGQTRPNRLAALIEWEGGDDGEDRPSPDDQERIELRPLPRRGRKSRNTQNRYPNQGA